MKIEVLEPHGFCAGVTAALAKAERLGGGGGVVYCLHEIVHNELVVADLKRRGFVFVERVEDVPEDATILFSAHGVAPAVRAAAAARRLKVVDATCPFVEKVHRAVRDFSARGLPIVIIGHADHAEVKGILGEAERAYVYPDLPPTGRFGLVSQTTMNADEVLAIAARLAAVRDFDALAEVCNATRDRQRAVRDFRGDALLVLGSANSSNTRRLCEISPVKVFRAGDAAELRALDFTGVATLGVTSGASTPESFFTAALEFLKTV